MLHIILFSSFDNPTREIVQFGILHVREIDDNELESLYVQSLLKN